MQLIFTDFVFLHNAGLKLYVFEVMFACSYFIIVTHQKLIISVVWSLWAIYG